MTISVLIIDDDKRLRALLTEYLGENDVVASSAGDGTLGLHALSSGQFDAVVLDIMMPGLDGLTVLRRLRERSTVPVVMLTAKGDETDRVVGLELGADDYLTKPFSPRELLARLRAVLRRGRGEVLGAWLRVGALALQREARQVTLAGAPIDLTALEFDLLLVLAERPGRVISRTTLWQLTGREDTLVGERAIDVHISHVRKKLRAASRGAQLIRTVRGVGYMLARDEPS